MREAWNRATANYPNDRAGAEEVVAQLASGQPGLAALVQYMGRSNQEQGK